MKSLRIKLRRKRHDLRRIDRVLPARKALPYAQVFEDPQVRYRGMRVDIPHPAGVPCPTVASPMRFSATPVVYEAPPPTLGQHTREILGGILGLSEAELDELSAGGVIQP